MKGYLKEITEKAKKLPKNFVIPTEGNFISN